MDEELKKALQEYVATVNSGKYQSWEEIDSKFPELGVYSAEVLKEYVATANSGKYQSWDEINSKFPELGKAQEVPAQGSADTSVTSGTQQSDSAEPLSAEPDIVISQQDIDNLSINDISPPEGISAGSVYIPYDTSKPVTDTETGEELPEGIRSAATALLESNPNRKVVGVLRDGQGVIYTEPDSPDVQRVYLAPVEGPFTNEGAMDPYVEASLITDGEWYQNDRGVWVYRMQEYPDDLSYDFINYFEKNIPDVAVEDPSGRTIYYGAGNGPTSDETAAQISYFQDPDTSRRLAGLIQGYRESNPNEYVPIRTISEINKAQGMIFQTPEQTTLSRAGKVVGDVAELSYNNLLLGVGGVLSGVIDLGLQAAALVKVPGEDWGSILTEYRTEGADNVRNVLVDVIGTDVNQYTADRYKNNIIAGGITSLAYSAPAFVGSKLRMGRIFLQSFDAAMGSIQEADQEGQLSNFSKSIYGLMVGSAVAGLEKLGFDAAFGGAVKRMGVAIANKTLRDVAQSGAKVTAATLERRLKDNLNQTSVRFLQGGANSLVGSLGEFFTEGAQGVFEGGSRYALNFLTGKDIFDTSDETWGSFAQDVLTQSAMGAVGGSIMGGVGSIIGAGRRQKVTQLSRQVYDIDTELRRGNLDQPTKEQLLKIKLESLSELSSIASDNNNEYLKLSAEQQIHLEELNKEAFELETIIADPEVSETVKAASNERLNRIDAEIGEIDKWTPQTETTEVSGTPQQEVAETLADASTPQSEVEATPVVKTEAEAQAGEYFTRDIGGEQTVYRRNEDGTASIVPDAEAQQVLAQQAETSPVSEQATQARVEEEGQPTSTQEAGGTSLQGPQQGGLSQNNAPATQDFFTAVVEGTDPRFIPIKPYETEGAYSPEQAKVAEAMEPKFGNFDTHIATSIPQYRETQVKKAAGIIAVLEGREDARVFDIGGSEGNMVKTITELTGVETYNLEPNEAMASSHEATPVEGSTVIREAFYEGFDGHEAHVPTEKYDVVNESMVFQFITPERKQFIDHVADNYLKEDGLFISEEKLKTNRDLYIENEAQKDREHKSKYYTPEQLKLKSDQVLMGMDENQADVRDYIEALKGRFKHVGLYWNSGNFYGVAASNSKQTFDTFMASVGDTQTQYTKVTLGEVTDPSTIPSSSQSTQELSAPTGTQTETVSTVLQEAGATPQESASFLEDLRTDEGRARRKAQALADFKKALGRTANVGISGDALAKALEYAIVSIIDGSVKSARALSQALGISQEQGQQIYDRAFQATQAMRDAVVTPPRRTVKAQVREATQGGITGTETVVVNSKKALKDQLRMAEVNARAGAAIGALNQKQAQKKHRDNVRNYKKVVRDYINSFKNTDLFKGVKIPADIVPRLTSKLSRIDETSPNAVTHIMNFSEYLEKLVDDINYDGKAQKAREESKRIRGEAKRLDKQRDLQGALQRLAALGATPSRLADIDGYLELAGRAIDRQGTTAATVMDINAFVNTQEKAYEAEQVRKQEAVNAVRREEALAHMQKIMDAEGIEGSAVDYYDESVLEYRPEGVPSDLPTPPETSKAKETLERVIAFNRKGLPRSIEGLSPYEANALEALINTPLEPLDTKALRALNTAITNAVVNGDLLSGTSEIVGRYRANRDAESWLDEFSAKKKHIVQGTSERATSLLPSRMKLDTNQIFKAVAGAAREMGEMLHSYVMGEINQGYTEAKQIVDKEVKKALDIYDKNKMKTRDAYKVGTALYLMNYETDGMWDSPQQAFDLKVNMIVQSRDALTDVLNRRDETLDDIDRRRYKRDERQLGILLKELDAIKTPEQFQETFLNAKQRVLYDHILEAWKSQKEATRDLYQKMGVKFTESELFAPTSFNNIIVSGISADQNIGIDSYHRPGGIDNVGKHVAERKGVTTLPTTKAEDGTIITRYLSLNAITNFDREFSRRMVDMKTIDGRIKAKYILSNADVRDALDAGGKLDNHESIVWKVTANIRDLNGISGFINDYDYGLDKITNVASRYFYRSSVGSLTQTVNQSVTNIPSIAANTSWGAWAQSSALMANNVYNNVMGNTSDRLVTDLINAAGASAYNRLASDMDQRMRSRLQGLDNEFENSFIKGLQKVDEAIGNITYLGLSGGDNFNTKNSWLAGYINSLKQQGVIKRYKDFNLEMLRKHIANPNRRAAEMADNVASAVNATMRQASRAESVKVKSRSQRVLNFMMGYLLKTFATSQNMEARLALNNIKRGDYTSKDYKILGGYLSNVFILSTLAREMWTAVFQGVGGLLAGAFFDEDELKKAEERRLERLGLTKEEEDRIRTQRRLIGRLAQGVGDVAFGSKPIIVESLGMLAIDKVYANMIVPYFDKGSTPQDRARMPIPASLFYTSEDNVFGVGGLDNINQVWTNIEKIATGSVPRDEEAIRSLQTMRGITAFLSTGVLGADMKRLSQQTLIPMERALKDGYFQMPDSYGVIKKAVNKYGLKPIPPFNKKIIYAEDSNNVIHAIPLSESDIDKINIEIGKRMVEMLPKEGYGQSLSNFNKNKLSIDDINRHMSDMKYNAEYDVILKLYGMHLSTPSAYEAQEEDNK